MTGIADLKLELAREARATTARIATLGHIEVFAGAVPCHVAVEGRLVRITVDLGTATVVATPEAPAEDVPAFEIVDPADLGIPPVEVVPLCEANAAGRSVPVPLGDDARVTVSGPWSDEERETARHMIRRGVTNPDIAEILCRDRRFVNGVLASLRAEVAAQDATTPVPSSAPAPSPAPAVQSAAERRAAAWAADLTRLGNDAVWSPARDLELAEALIRGTKARQIAVDWGMAVQTIQRRWGALFRDREITTENQAVLLDLLRARAAAAEAQP